MWCCRSSRVYINLPPSLLEYLHIQVCCHYATLVYGLVPAPLPLLTWSSLREPPLPLSVTGHYRDDRGWWSRLRSPRLFDHGRRKWTFFIFWNIYLLSLFYPLGAPAKVSCLWRWLFTFYLRDWERSEPHPRLLPFGGWRGLPFSFALHSARSGGRWP